MTIFESIICHALYVKDSSPTLHSAPPNFAQQEHLNYTSNTKKTRIQ